MGSGLSQATLRYNYHDDRSSGCSSKRRNHKPLWASTEEASGDSEANKNAVKEPELPPVNATVTAVQTFSGINPLDRNYQIVAQIGRCVCRVFVILFIILTRRCCSFLWLEVLFQRFTSVQMSIRVRVVDMW
jgi:hypothetical protein